jgi:RNA polymerase sigma factor (sigma-70 family)
MVKGMQADSAKQFEIQINEHRKILYKICNVYCANADDREDLAQEMLAQLWRSFSSFDGRCLFSTWMYKVALNTAISFTRREFTRRRYVIPVEERILASVPIREKDSAELQMLYELIDELDPLNKAMVLLYLDGNSYQEISDVLGITPTNVATKLNRLKEKLKEKFERTGTR